MKYDTLRLFFSLDSKYNLKLMHRNSRLVNNCSPSALHNLLIDLLLYLVSITKFSQYYHSKLFQNCKPETSKITKLLHYY